MRTGCHREHCGVESQRDLGWRRLHPHPISAPGRTAGPGCPCRGPRNTRLGWAAGIVSGQSSRVAARVESQTSLYSTPTLSFRDGVAEPDRMSPPQPRPRASPSAGPRVRLVRESSAARESSPRADKSCKKSHRRGSRRALDELGLRKELWAARARAETPDHAGQDVDVQLRALHCARRLAKHQAPCERAHSVRSRRQAASAYSRLL